MTCRVSIFNLRFRLKISRGWLVSAQSAVDACCVEKIVCVLCGTRFFSAMHWIALYCQLFLITDVFINVVSGTPSDNDKCFEATHGKRKLFTNRMGYDQIVICTKMRRGTYRWRFLDGSPSHGEKFDPAKDCSGIVDHLADATDGFYWITLGGEVEKVWCDVHTDGGGYMLIGMTDSPITWSIPSNKTPVDPKGPPHWSSSFGNVKVLDFAVQVSTNNNFDETRAHWSYRLKVARSLGSLFGLNKGGCTDVHSGIWNVEYVKDIFANISTKFECSLFGPHYRNGLGWERMNYCLKHDCLTGFGNVRGHQTEGYGSFSYSATNPSSGLIHDATAFVGCDSHQCCACFGPKKGKQHYCGPRCTAKNGGTVLQQASAWFWVRTSIPERVWKRCMEFKVTTKGGTVDTYFIDRTTGFAHKGTCSYHFHTFLNEGTISVSDKNSLENLPPVPGLVSYRQDNGKLYVNTGTQWDALSSERKVNALAFQTYLVLNLLNLKFLLLENKITGVADELLSFSSCTKLKEAHLEKPSGYYRINPTKKDGFFLKVYCDMTSRDGVGVTLVEHDSEQQMKVNGYEEPGSYKRKITYEGNMVDIAALTEVSMNCRQHIRYSCYNSIISSDDEQYAWLYLRQGRRMSYYVYACGWHCNCNRQGSESDDVYITDRSQLPVTELRYGDTGGEDEYGYHTLGKLECWG